VTVKTMKLSAPLTFEVSRPEERDACKGVVERMLNEIVTVEMQTMSLPAGEKFASTKVIVYASLFLPPTDIHI